MSILARNFRLPNSHVILIDPRAIHSIVFVEIGRTTSADTCANFLQITVTLCRPTQLSYRSKLKKSVVDSERGEERKKRKVNLSPDSSCNRYRPHRCTQHPRTTYTCADCSTDLWPGYIPKNSRPAWKMGQHRAPKPRRFRSRTLRLAQQSRCRR